MLTILIYGHFNGIRFNGITLRQQKVMANIIFLQFFIDYKASLRGEEVCCQLPTNKLEL